MKTLSRLLCNGNPDIKVMPHCFDRWKQWIKMRKLFAYWLTYTSNFANPRRHALSQAFNKWRGKAPTLKSDLTRIKREDLEYISIKNDEKMNYLAQSFEDCGEAVDDLTT